MRSFTRKTIIVTLFSLFTLQLTCQVLSSKEFISAMRNADNYFYFNEDFERAAALYEPLLEIFPDNCNLSAKLGICCLNIEGREHDALRLLSKATGNIVENDDEYVEYGEKAPLETYLYHAIAYHLNDSLEKALIAYENTKRNLLATDVFRQDYIDLLIRNCRYAIEMEKRPLPVEMTLYTPWLVEYPGAINPVISSNDSVFIFTVKKEEETRIMCSSKEGNSWAKPEDITRQLGKYDRLFSNSVTGNGKMLILYADDNGDGNLFYSTREGSVWSKARRLGKNINTIYWESHGFITSDGNKLFFTSNRPGGKGELDIWVSEISEKGKWLPPTNCGNVINTPYNEETPYYDVTSNTLLFSSIGHTGMGDYDVFKSVNKNGSWTKPIGIPFAFNTTARDIFFIPDYGTKGYVTGMYNAREGAINIYSLIAKDVSGKIVTVHGHITLQDDMPLLSHNTSIHISGTDTPDTTISLLDSAEFRFSAKPGDYQLYIKHTGYVTDTISLNIPVDFEGSYVNLNCSLMPEQVFTEDFLVIRNVFFEFDSYGLNDSSIATLEDFRTILTAHPSLKIEVAGYTDSKGSREYNKMLADRRAQTVIDYLSEAGIPGDRFLKTAFGESGFIAINTNSDGTDNPEGRRYNRRVAFGIKDPQTGITISRPVYSPEHLRQPYSMKYNVVLLKTTLNTPQYHFSDLMITPLHSVSSLVIDSSRLYIIGQFYNKYDAIKYLDYAKETGYSDAYIVTQYEVNRSSPTLTNDRLPLRQTDKITYTVQLMATRNSVSINSFKTPEEVREIIFGDGIYRYITGEYDSKNDALTALRRCHESGYKDAFIREMNLITNR